MSIKYPELPLYTTYCPSTNSVWLRKIHETKLVAEKKFPFHDLESKKEAIRLANKYSDFIEKKFGHLHSTNPPKMGLHPEYPGVFFSEHRSGRGKSSWEATITWDRNGTFTVPFSIFLFQEYAVVFAVMIRAITRWIRENIRGVKYAENINRFEEFRKIKRSIGGVRLQSKKDEAINIIDDFLTEWAFDIGLTCVTFDDFVACLSQAPEHLVIRENYM